MFFTTCFNICQGVRASPGHETPIARAGADEGDGRLVARQEAAGVEARLYAESHRRYSKYVLPLIHMGSLPSHI